MLKARENFAATVAICVFVAIAAYAEKQELPKEIIRSPRYCPLSRTHRSLHRPRKIAEVVSAQSSSVLALVRTGTLPLHLGRKSLILEMANEPGQLGKDLPRISPIRIAKVAIPANMRKGKSAEQQFDFLSLMLERYVGHFRPALVDRKIPGRIGMFYTSEILFGMVQNWSGPAVEMAYQDPILQSGEWASEAGVAEQDASFVLEPSKTAILSVTFTSKKILKNMSDSTKKDKILITQAALFYYLDSGEVTFLHSYSIDDRGSARMQQSL